MTSGEVKEKKQEESKSNLKTPNSVLKKHSSFCSCLDYFMVDRCVEDLVQQHRTFIKTNKFAKLDVYPNDDCLYRPSILETEQSDPTFIRVTNAAWRRWYQKYFNLPKFHLSDEASLPTNLLPKRLQRRVSFNDTVDEMILPPTSSLLSLDLEYEEDELEEDPGFIDNLGSVCFNILITFGSLLTPYYSSKKLKSWLY